MHYLQGPYKLKNPGKYTGNRNNIFFRSSWEFIFYNWLDTNTKVLKWSSEENCIPYISPVDNKKHRYFPDAQALIQTKNGPVEYLIEIKPQIQTAPPKQPKRKTRQFIQKVMTYAINEAKWDAARSYCEKKGWTFKIITEKDLFSHK